VVAAGFENGTRAIGWVARYDTDGSLDTDFGTRGDGFVRPLPGDDGWASSVVLDSSGGILVLGYTVIERETGKGKKKKIEYVGMLALARLVENGDLDDTFGDVDPDDPGERTGVTLVENAGSGTAMALNSDDEIVAVGRHTLVERTKVKGRWVTTTNDALVLVRFDADGALDTSFGSEGIVIDDISAIDDSVGPNSVGLQSDGKIVVAGVQWDIGQGFLRRYGTDGSVDTWSGTEDLVTLEDVGQGPSLTIDGSNRILVATEASGDGIVERYSKDGALDTSFADAGRYATGLTGDDQLRGVSLLADGRIVACGFTLGTDDGFVLRLTADGDLDTYGISDLATVGIVSDCAIDPDGNYVICCGKDGDFILARYCGN